ncbi:hypothetical protein BCON_0400g00030 [Botryotinia convoluta]|uniref:Uncharacterized protein n=1 Tax=Botryotinia convoluta TaxID=54673 RepID=A0A4Z1HK20_9HELO|nr:hypothetical protein BCON_0400g00030 [Botryotinia convoluta]
MNRTPLPDQRMATTKKTTIKSSKSTAKPRKVTMSAASRRINAISKHTIIGRIKAQVQKDTNKKFKSNRTAAQSLGKKSQRGRELPWLELPEPETLLHQDEKTLEFYIFHRNHYAPLQHLKKTMNMTWDAIQAIHAEHFPDKLVPKSGNVLSSCASSYYHKLWVIIEAEKESVTLAEATQNPQFVFPDEEDDEDDEYSGSYLDG